MFVPPQLPLSQLMAHAGKLHQTGNLAGAVGVYRQVLRQQPRNAQVLGRLAEALIGLGQLDEAKRSLEQALRISPKAPVLHHDMHLLHRRRGEMAKAHESLDKALKLSPRHPIFTASKAELFSSEGEWDRAVKTIEPVLATAGQYAPVAMVFANLSPRVGREADAVAALRANLANTETPPALLVRVGFALAHLLDFIGDFDGAAEAAGAANALRAGTWDIDAHEAKIRRCMEVWTREGIAAMPSSSVRGDDLVLVVGMPRCGNLLVTRILASTDGIVSVGERNDLLQASRELEGGTTPGAPILLNMLGCTASALTERGSAYLTTLRNAHPEVAVKVDRNPMNLLAVGLASRLVPGVRVIHCRRDSADSAVACWFAPFTANVPFMYDQTALGSFQRCADRLMDHWKAVLDIPFLDVAYEDLLGRPEATAKRIVEFAGGTWSEKALTPARAWVATVPQPDGTLRDVIPDGRPGLGQDYQARLPELFAALNKA